MSYCTVMYVLYVLHVVVLCVGKVLLYAALCHHHGLPRVQMKHISRAEYACTPSEGDAYLIATKDGMFVPHYMAYVHTYVDMCTYVFLYLCTPIRNMYLY